MKTAHFLSPSFGPASPVYTLASSTCPSRRPQLVSWKVNLPQFFSHSPFKLSRLRWLTVTLHPRYFLSYSVFLRIGSGACMACSLLCCSVVCFAQTAVFALNTARTPSPVLPPVWYVNSIWEANPQSRRQHGLGSGVADSWTEPGLARHIFQALFSQACVQAFFPLRNGYVSQPQHCHWVLPDWSCLIGILEKELLLRRWGESCDSMILGERAQGQIFNVLS